MNRDYYLVSANVDFSDGEGFYLTIMPAASVDEAINQYMISSIHPDKVKMDTMTVKIMPPQGADSKTEHIDITNHPRIKTG